LVVPPPNSAVLWPALSAETSTSTPSVSPGGVHVRTWPEPPWYLNLSTPAPTPFNMAA